MTTKEIKKLIDYIIDNNKTLTELNLPKTVLSLVGEHGIGKTSIVQQVALQRNADYVRVNFAQIEELGDLIGYNIKEVKLCHPEGGEWLWINEKLIEQYLKLGYKLCGIPENRMSYAIPEWIPTNPEKETIILFDDYTRADPRIIQALMSVMENGGYISWKLPKNCHIIITRNPDNGEYLVNDLDAAQRTRFIEVECNFDKDSWAEWAITQGIRSEFISFFLQYHTELFNIKSNNLPVISPRGVVNFLNALHGIADIEANQSLVYNLAYGSFGRGGEQVAALFIKFMLQELKHIPEAKFVLTGKIQDVITDLDNKLYNGKELNYAISFLLATRICYYIKTELNKDKSKAERFADRLVELYNSKNEYFSMDITNYLGNYISELDACFASKLVSGSEKFKQSFL